MKKKFEVIDLGIKNTKIIRNLKGNCHIFGNNLALLNADESCDKDVIEYKGKRYGINYGSYENETIKTARKNWIYNFLYALTLGTPDTEFTTDLVMLLPITQDAGTYKNLSNKTYEFKINDRQYKITVENVNVLEEGKVSIAAIPKEVKEGDSYLFDLGSSTTIVYHFENGKMTDKESFAVITRGCNYLMTNLKDALSKRKKDPIDLDFNRFEKYWISNKIQPKTEKCFTDAAKDHFDHIINELKTKKMALQFADKLIFAGGGALAFKELIEHYFKDFKGEIIILNDSVFSNVKGAFRIAKAKKWIDDNEN